MIRLVREETDVQDATNNRHQWPVKYTATYTADDTPAKIFVMQTAADDIFGDSLSCIANAIQMTDLPEDVANDSGPFYRVSVITKLCRSAAAADEFIEKVENTVQDLVDNLTAADTLTVSSDKVFSPSA